MIPPLLRPSPSSGFFSRPSVGSLCIALVLCLTWLAGGRAQLPGTVDPAFGPIARTAGAITAIATQADGKQVIGGRFYRVGSVVAQSVARLNPDGSVDASFVPPTGLGAVEYLAMGADGKVVLLAQVGNPYGQTYSLLRLNADGSQDIGFSPTTILGEGNSGQLVTLVLAVQADGKVLVGGSFNVEPDSTANVNTVKRYNTDGSLDTTFQLSNHLQVEVINALLPLSNGQVLVGAGATDYNGQSYSGRVLIRLNSDGSVDENYNPDTGSAGSSFSMVLQPDGKIIYLAEINAPPGQSVLGLLGGVPKRLNADGSADTSFAPQLTTGAAFRSLVLQPDGKVLLGGYTANYEVPTTDPYSFTSVLQNGVVRLNADGSADTTFHPPVPLVDNTVTALGLLPDGRVIVGGDFGTFGSLTQNGLGLLNADGTVVTGYTNSLSSVAAAYAVAVQANGLPLLLDATNLGNGTTSGPLVSLNLDGSVNTVFQFSSISEYTLIYPTPNQPGNSVISQQTDGKILVTGSFGTSESGYGFPLQRFNLDGSLDTTFQPDFSSEGKLTYAVLPQPDGYLLIAGNTIYDGGESYPLARLTADGSFDSTFSPAVDPGTSNFLPSTLYALALQPDGKVVAGGFLNPVDGAASAGVLRFNSDGSLDTSFQAGAQSEAATGTTPYVLALGLQADGKVIVGGYFSTIGGVPCNNVARLNADGSLDTNFNANGAGADGVVRSIAVQADGKIILGGEFTAVNGVARAGVVRLGTDGSVDPQFTPGTGTAGNGHVNSVALAPDGSVIVGGTFTQFNGVARDGVVRLFGGDIPPAPVVTSSPTASGQAGQTFAYQIAASNHPTSYAAAGLPPGLNLNTATGSINGTPTATGTFPVTVSATNLGGTGTATLTLTITPPTPVVTVAAGVSARVNQAFSYQIAASNEPTSYTAGGLPAGLSVNAATGLISGTPTAAGTFTVTLGATNAGGTGNASLILTVVPALPVITLTADVPQVTAGSGNVGEFTLTRSGDDLSTQLLVAYMVKGSAVDGTDYVMLKGVRKMKAGKRTAKIKVEPLGDGAGPGTKRVVTLVLAPGDGYTVGTTAKVKVKIYGR